MTKIVTKGQVRLKVVVPGEPTEWLKIRNDQQANIAMKHIESRFSKERPDRTITFGEFADLWKEDHLLAACHSTTYLTYASALDRYLVPHFGNDPLASVSKAGIQKFMTQQRAIMNERTLIKTIEILSSMLACAVRWRYLKDNPATGVFDK